MNRIEPSEYEPTLFDRHGPGAADSLRAWAYGLMVFGISLSAFTLQRGFSLAALVGCALAGIATAGVGLLVSQAVGGAWKRALVDGTSTPYKEQYSYQQALVMQGKIDEALESYEGVIAEKPDAVDVRLRAAELYVKERANHARAADLFRQVQRCDGASSGEWILATNRLVDLLAGPLETPGRAAVELRRLIERYPSSAAAEHARAALRTLKALSARE